MARLVPLFNGPIAGVDPAIVGSAGLEKSTAVSWPGSPAAVYASLPATAVARAPERLVLLLTAPTRTGAVDDASALTGSVSAATAINSARTQRTLHLSSSGFLSRSAENLK